MASSRSYNKLLYAWEAWHDAAGVPIRRLYPEFVKLSNKASVADGKNQDYHHCSSKYVFSKTLQYLKECT